MSLHSMYLEREIKVENGSNIDVSNKDGTLTAPKPPDRAKAIPELLLNWPTRLQAAAAAIRFLEETQNIDAKSFKP